MPHSPIPPPARAQAFDRLALGAVRALPRNALSRLVGRAASLHLPAAWRAPVCRAFAAAVGADLSEVRDPLERFESLQAFFTRALRDGARPLDPAPDAILSPCDGAWGAAGRVESGLVLQVKGRPYALRALLGSADEAARFEGGTFATLYLSPRDYHRFHVPCAVRVRAARHLPGTLWPVNRLGVEQVDGLFAENERIVMQLDVEPPGRGGLCVVAVGATLVGCVRVCFDDLTTNVAGARVTTRDYGERGARFDRGEELGRFEFGSTLVVVVPPEAGALEPRPAGTPLRLGTRIGTLSLQSAAPAGSSAEPCQPRD